MTLIEKLRQETRLMHEELDQAMVPHIHNIRSAEAYARLLEAFYGFFKPVYDRIDSAIDVSFLPDYSQRRKPQHITENRNTLGYTATELPLAEQLPHITGNASAFGALYVLEGSTLGGLMIKKMLGEQTGLADEQLSFFAGYGKQTRERWNTFVKALNEMPQKEEDEQQAVQAAADTFTFFKQWLHTVYL